MRAASGHGGVRNEQAELPAVMSGVEAKQLVEEALAARWRSAERIRLRAAPTGMNLRPGDAFQLPGSSRAWTVRNAVIEGMVVALEAETAPVTVEPLPADPGRPVSESDVAVGRTELMLFELPEFGDAPLSSVRAFLAGSNQGRWKAVPVEVSVAGSPQSMTALTRRAVAGWTESVLGARTPLILDELSSVEVRLANAGQVLLNADWDALIGGANLSVIGQELVQFGRAEQLGPGHFRLSKLLRGRRGTEWAAGQHAIGEIFCLIEVAAIRPLDVPASSAGAELRCIAHGIGDSAPLPQVSRNLSGEAMRPPSPCHLKVTRIGSNLQIEWVRRSHLAWAWLDGIGDSADSFTEACRLILEGPAGTEIIETADRAISLTPAQIPGSTGQQIGVSVAAIGPAALSHPAIRTIIL